MHGRSWMAVGGVGGREQQHYELSGMVSCQARNDVRQGVLILFLIKTRVGLPAVYSQNRREKLYPGIR